MSERHIRLCQTAINVSVDGVPASMRFAGHHRCLDAHPPELLLVMHQIPKYVHDDGKWRCLTCRSESYSVDGPASKMIHGNDCPVGRYEELTK